MILDEFGNIESVYFKRYKKLILHFLTNIADTGELHHILPRSLYPSFSKNPENLVRLPHRAHFLAHYFLFKFTKTPQMAAAFNLMRRYSRTSRIYELNRKEVERLVGELAKGKKWCYDPETLDTALVRVLPKGWVYGNPLAAEGKRELFLGTSWWINQDTNEVARCKIKPNGNWIKGRANFVNSGLKKMNSISKKIDLKRKEKILSEDDFPWMFNDQGKRLSDIFVFVRENLVYLKSTLPIVKSRKLRGVEGEDMSGYKVPRFHHNMSYENKKFCLEHYGKTIEELGFSVYNINTFIWKEEYERG